MVNEYIRIARGQLPIQKNIMEPIAIVGFAFRLPGSVNDIESLMDILEQGRDLMGPWPDDRINLAAFYSPDNKKLNSVGSILSST